MRSPSADDAPDGNRQRIVAAAARLLDEHGANALSMRAVAQAADVPTPTIFRTFGSKQGLLEAVAERVMANYAEAEAKEHLNESGDPVEALRRAWEAHLAFGLAHPDLYVMLVTPGGLQQSPATERASHVLRARVASLAAAGVLAVPEARAVEAIHAAGSGLVLALLGQEPDCRDPELGDLVLDGVLSVILSTTPAPPATQLPALLASMRKAIPALSGLSPRERDLLDEWLDRAVEG